MSRRQILKVVFVNPILNTSYTNIFIGKVPIDVVHGITKKNISKKRLAEVYDETALEDILKFISIKGADDEDFDIDIGNNELSNELSNKSIELSQNELEELSNQHLDESKEEEQPDPFINNVISRSSKIKDGSVTIIPEDIYTDDTIYELKLKIQTYCNISIYRQHLYWLQGTTAYQPYKLSVSSKFYPIDISNDKFSVKLSTIPIDRVMFDILSKEPDDLHVLANDTFMTVSDTVFNTDHKIFIVDLESFIKSKIEISNLITDTYQFSMIMFGFIFKYYPWFNHELFKIYLNSEPALSEYPDFCPATSQLRKMFSEESKILNNINQSRVDEIEKNMSVSLINATVSVNPVRPIEINLRALFDYISTDRQKPLISVFLVHNDLLVNIKKTALSEPTPKIPVHLRSGLVICVRADIKVEASEGTNTILKYLYCNIQSNGRWSIYSSWSEEDSVDFDLLVKICNLYTHNIIESINLLDKKISASGTPLLSPMSKDNVLFNGIVATINWKQSLSESTFKELKEYLDSCLKGGIIKSRGIQVANFEFMFCKGITDYDKRNIQYIIGRTQPFINYYSWMSSSTVNQLWKKFYGGKIVRVYNRTTDLKIEIINIKEDSFITFYDYILQFLSCIRVTNTVTVKTNVKRIKKLHEQDPELYDLKRWGGKKVFSKICQEGRQPLIWTDAEMKTASKEKLTKFWNFTANKTAYYSCPDKVYSNLNFVVGEHPNGWCLPCCGKKQLTSESNKKIIQEACLLKYKYDPKILETKLDENKYIMQYGKDIDKDRLGLLPDSITDFIEVWKNKGNLNFKTKAVDNNNTNSSNNKIKDKIKDKINDKIKDNYYIYGVEQNLPAINNIGFVFCLAYILDKSIEKLTTEIQALDYKDLYGGTLNSWFGTEFKATLKTVFGSKSQFSKVYFSGWNELFIEIANKVYNLNTIFFKDDTGVIGCNTGYGKININNKFMVIFERNGLYYPIVETHSKTKLFSNTDAIITSSINSATFNNTEILSFYNVNNLCKKNKFNVISGVTNIYGNVYGVHVNINGKKIFVPISTTKVFQDLEFVDTITTGTYSATLEFINSFTAQFNVMNIVGLSKFNDQIVCIIVNINGVTFNFWVTPVSVSKPQFEVFDLLYNPLEIMSLISKRLPPEEDRRTKLISKSIYNSKIYRLLNIEFIAYVNTQTNKKVRSGVIDLVKSKDKLTFVEIADGIKKIFKDENLSAYTQDMFEISKQISQYVITSEAKNKIELLTNVMQTSRYHFDQLKLIEFRKMPKDKLVAELTKIFSKITTAGHITNNVVDNIYYPCQYSLTTTYCAGNKLILDNVKIEDYLPLLADDILNPLKETFFETNNLLNIMYYFNFNVKIGEQIEIS
jgi:hypothetical protein